MAELDKIIDMIFQSLDKLYCNDSYLIKNSNGIRNNHVSERGIVFRFGIYFDSIAQIEFPILNVDSEYNRNQGDLKRLPSRQNGSYPDLILHKRGTNSNNILVVEFKPWWDNHQDEDKKKIEDFCNKEGEYAFNYGVLILLGKKRDEVIVNLYNENNWKELKQTDGSILYRSRL